MSGLIFTPQTDADLREIENNPSQRNILKALRKCLGLLETNLRLPSLKTHEFRPFKGPNGEKVFEAYVQQKAPGAYRFFWYYGPERGMITIVAITPHPCQVYGATQVERVACTPKYLPTGRQALGHAGVAFFHGQTKTFVI